MNKNTTKLLLGTSLFSLMCLMASCGKSQSSESQDYHNTEQVRRYKNKCADSIRTARGYDSIYAKYNQLDAYPIYRKIDSLEWAASLGNAIEKSVKNSARKIINKFFADLGSLLGRYEISLSDYTCGEDEDYFYFNTNTNAVCKNDLIFTGINLYPENQPDDEASNLCGITNEFNPLIDIVQEIVDKSSYNKTRKDEIMNHVHNLVEKTKDKLIASRKSAEQQYADYYLKKDNKDDIAVEECGEGDRTAGYGNFRWNSRGCVKKVLHTQVYDSKLPVAFFGDKDAEYKLISLGNDKWQVQKKTASGKIEKTAVFTDKGHIEGWLCFDDIDAKNENCFSYEPGENMGVHVFYSEYKIIKRAKKKWVPNKDITRQINSLTKQMEKVQAQSDELYDRLETIRNYADSVATVKASQRFRSR